MFKEVQCNFTKNDYCKGIQFMNKFNLLWDIEK